MIAITDIYKTVTSILKAEFPKHRIYSNNVLEGLKKPSFFVELEPVNIGNDSINFRKCKYRATITCFEETRDYIHNISLATQLEKAFGYGFKVNYAYAITSDFDFTFTNAEEDLLQISVTFEYVEDTQYIQQKDNQENHEIARRIYLN